METVGLGFCFEDLPVGRQFKTIDLVIGTFCIECGHLLLHDDRDFEPMVRFLGLRTA